MKVIRMHKSLGQLSSYLVREVYPNATQILWDRNNSLSGIKKRRKEHKKYLKFLKYNMLH